MEALHTILTAALTGFISGLLLSIPVGPVNLTIVNEGAREGFWWAALIGLGATAMEIVYCTIAFTGFASLLRGPMVNTAMEIISFSFLLYLGVRFLLARRLLQNSRLEQRLEARWHPHSAFMIGFTRVLGNPGVLVFWLILAAYFISHGWVKSDALHKLVCVGGVALGTGLWFVGLSYAVSLGHARFSERTLVRMEHVSGILLLLVAAAHGINILHRMLQAG